MGKTRTNNKHKRRHTRSQQGGIKVLLPNFHNPVMEREIKNTQNIMNYMNSFKFVNLIFTKQFTLVKNTMMLMLQNLLI